jgi:N-acyl-L-homoserine lactone synthetase
MEFIAARLADLSPAMIADIARYRHQIFVERLGWRLPDARDGFELDQFDGPDTWYVTALNDEGSVVGTARLLPTTRPYLLKEIFPCLMELDELPDSPHVWELSRFAVGSATEQDEGAMSVFSSPVAVDLLQAVLDCAASEGATSLITVSPLGVERLLRRAGFRASRAGQPVNVNGHMLFACWIAGTGRDVVDEGRVAEMDRYAAPAEALAV